MTDRNIGKGERSAALLDCIEARTKMVPLDFIKIVGVLEAEPYLESLATQLVQSYCKFVQNNSVQQKMLCSCVHVSMCYGLCSNSLEKILIAAPLI